MAPASPASPRSSRRCRPGRFSTASGRWQQAKAADELRREGKGVGPLHGVPVGIKDIIDTADMPTENGCAVLQGPAAATGCRLHHRAAPRRRRHHRQDRHHGAGHLHARRDAQSAQPRAHARRLLRRARRRPWLPAWCRWRSARRRRLRHPPGRLLRHLRLQADLRPHPAPRRADAGAVARHRRRVRPLGGGPGPARRRPAGPTTTRDAGQPRRQPPASARHRHARTGRCRRMFAFVKTHAWSEADAGDARSLRRARRGAGRAGQRNLARFHLPSAARMPPRSSRTSSWPPTSARCSTARPTAQHGAGQADRGGPARDAASTTSPPSMRASSSTPIRSRRSSTTTAPS